MPIYLGPGLGLGLGLGVRSPISLLLPCLLLCACPPEDPAPGTPAPPPPEDLADLRPAEDLLPAPDLMPEEKPDPAGLSVQVGRSGRLLYLPDARGNTVPDFSHAGYRGGGVRLPTAPVKVTLSPPAGDSDAAAAIQGAIDQVAALPPDSEGIRGAVLLRRGTYRIAGTLRVRVGGIVLRGEGEGTDGTVLVAAGTGQRTLIQIGGTGRWQEVAGTRRSLTESYVPVGARSFAVDSTAGLSVGDTVIVHRPSTAAWIHDIGMDMIPPRGDGMPVTQWAEGSKDLLYDRVITGIRDGRVTVDAPLTNAFEQKYGGGGIYKYTYAGRIAQVGVEDLRGDSDYKSATDEDHGWTFIALDSVQNAWVQRVTAIHYGLSAVRTGDGARWVTVQDCTNLDPISIIDGSRRYAFNLDGGQLILFQRNRAVKGRHDFVSGATVPGPNVFLQGVAEQAYSEAGPHQRWAAGTLYDNIKTSGSAAALSVYNRSNLGTGHGWAGANHVLWNSSSDAMRCESPPTATNWCIGCVTPKRSGACKWESIGKAVAPQSLYLAQLRDRLGQQAVDNISK